MCLEGTTERSDSIRGRSPREEAIVLILPGIFVQASAESNLFGLCRVQPKISKKWHYATGPASIIHPPHCISDNSCDRPGRHLSYCNYSCPFVQFVGKIISLRTSARKRQLQVVPCCPRCRHIPHCISVDSCDRPGRHSRSA